MRMLWCIGLMCCSVSSCAVSDDIEVQAVNVRLVSIDTLMRADQPLKQLTWMSNRHVKYVTLTTLNAQVTLGSEMNVLTKR